ncbi:MAG TPA: hypothetical protein VK668_13760 [Mucilaginibacter sp.]|nr:hypothetical protein [Mucilaginibacter sp.]
MKVEDPIALRFIFQDELYLLNEDKNFYNSPPESDQDEAPEPQREVKTPQVNFNYLGANKKNLLLLVNYAGYEFMQDTHLTALENVLTRMGYTRDDVAILNMAKFTGTLYEQITAYFEPQKLILLGAASLPSGLDKPAFNLPEKRENLTILYTFSFDEMMTNNDHKKAFWEQMKTL